MRLYKKPNIICISIEKTDIVKTSGLTGNEQSKNIEDVFTDLFTK